MSGALPKQLSFPQLKATAVRAVASQYSVTPVSGQSWSPGGTVSFDIPLTE